MLSVRYAGTGCAGGVGNAESVPFLVYAVFCLTTFLGIQGFWLLGVAESFSYAVNWSESRGGCVWDSWFVPLLRLIDPAWTCCGTSLGMPVLSAFAVLP